MTLGMRMTSTDFGIWMSEEDMYRIIFWTVGVSWQQKTVGYVGEKNKRQHEPVERAEAGYNPEFAPILCPCDK